MKNSQNIPEEPTNRRSQPPLALSVPLSRVTLRVGGGSAFFVRHQDRFKILQSWLVWRRFEQLDSDEQAIGS
jgi:hypothetical protein